MPSARRKKNNARKGAMREQSKRDGAKRCLAAKRNGKPCMRPAGWGTKHPERGRCKHHGGATRAHALQEAHRQVAAAAQPNGMARALRVSPVQAIQAALCMSAGQLAYVNTKVAELLEEDMYEEYVNAETGIPQVLPNVWLTVQRQVMLDMAKYAKQAADMGLAERDMNLREQQTQMVANLLQGVLAELGLSREQRALVAPAIRKNLQLIPGGPGQEATPDGNPIIEGSAVKVAA